MIVEKRCAPRFRGLDEEAPSTEECPICFNYVAKAGLNTSTCCKQRLCTECFLQVQLPTLQNDCPFCQRPRFSISYTVPSPEALGQAKALHAPRRSRRSATPSSPTNAVPISSPIYVGRPPPIESASLRVASVADRVRVEEEMAAQMDSVAAVRPRAATAPATSTAAQLDPAGRQTWDTDVRYDFSRTRFGGSWAGLLPTGEDVAGSRRAPHSGRGVRSPGAQELPALFDDSGEYSTRELFALRRMRAFVESPTGEHAPEPPPAPVLHPRAEHDAAPLEDSGRPIRSSDGRTNAAARAMRPRDRELAREFGYDDASGGTFSGSLRDARAIEEEMLRQAIEASMAEAGQDSAGKVEEDGDHGIVVEGPDIAAGMPVVGGAGGRAATGSKASGGGGGGGSARLSEAQASPASSGDPLPAPSLAPTQTELPPRGKGRARGQQRAARGNLAVLASPILSATSVGDVDIDVPPIRLGDPAVGARMLAPDRSRPPSGSVESTSSDGDEAGLLSLALAMSMEDVEAADSSAPSVASIAGHIDELTRPQPPIND